MLELKLKKCLSCFPHRIYHLITSTVSSVSSSGLPYRLPDTVRPAAVLQHVLRPPQPSRETNPSVYRPLASPSAAPAHHLPSSAPSHDPHNEFTAKEKEVDKRGGGWDGKRLMHVSIALLLLHSCDGMKDSVKTSSVAR